MQHADRPLILQSFFAWITLLATAFGGPLKAETTQEQLDRDPLKARARVWLGVVAAAWLVVEYGLTWILLAINNDAPVAYEDRYLQGTKYALGVIFILVAAALGYSLWKTSNRFVAICLVIWTGAESLYKLSLGVSVTGTLLSVIFFVLAAKGMQGAFAVHRHRTPPLDAQE